MACCVLLWQTKNYKQCFMSEVHSISSNTTKKKSKEAVKHELLNSLKENEDEKEPGLDISPRSKTRGL